MNSICLNLLLLFSFLTLIEPSVRFTNIKCESLHPEFSIFEKCLLKVVGRGVIALNIDVKLFQVPVNNVSMNLSLHKKANGYRPFLYNQTFDYCKFVKNRKRTPFAKVFFDILQKESNMNHTCPYDHNIIVDNLILVEDKLKYLPLPLGDYMFQMQVGAYNDWKAIVKAYIEITTDL